jgi:hypothetical protein
MMPASTKVSRTWHRQATAAALALGLGLALGPARAAGEPEGATVKGSPARTASNGRAQFAAGAPRAAAPAALQARLFHIKFKDPGDAALLVSPLLSENGSVTTQPKLRTLTVQDMPAILDRIQDLLASFDVPPRSVEFTVTLILASLAEEASADGKPPISRVVRGIADALPDITRWTNYKTLDSVKIEGSEGSKTTRDLADSYKVEFTLESVSESRGIIRLNPFSLLKGETDASGALVYRPVYTTTVNLKNEKLLTIGATKSETSPRALFLAMRARIEAP